MANTEQIEAKLCAYVDGDLDAVARAEIEQHLAANPQHRQLLAELMEQRNLLRDLPREKAPEDLFESFQTQLERSVLLDANRPSISGPRNRFSQVMAMAAIFVLAVGLLSVIYFVLPDKSRQREYSVLTTTTAPAAGETLTRMIASTPTTLPAAPGGMPVDSIAKSVAEPLYEAKATGPAVSTAAQPALAMKGGRSVDILSKTDAPVHLADKNGINTQTAAVNGFATLAPIDAEIADRVKQSPRMPQNSMVMVVATANPTATDQQVAGYLAMNKIRWEEDVPAPTPQSIAGGKGEGVASKQASVQATSGQATSGQAGAEKSAEDSRKESQKLGAVQNDTKTPQTQPAASDRLKDIGAGQQAVAIAGAPATQSIAANSVAIVDQQQQGQDADKLTIQQSIQPQAQKAMSQQPKYIVARGLTQSQVAELSGSIAAQNMGSVANFQCVDGAITPTTLPATLSMQLASPTTQQGQQITFAGGTFTGSVGGGGGSAANRQLDVSRATTMPTGAAAGQLAKAPSTTTAPALDQTISEITAPPFRTGAPTTQPSLTASDVAAAAIATGPLTPGPATAPTSQLVTIAAPTTNPTTNAFASTNAQTNSQTNAPTSTPTTSPSEERVDVVIVVKSTVPDQADEANQVVATPSPAITTPAASIVIPPPPPTSAPAPATTQPVPSPILKARRP